MEKELLVLNNINLINDDECNPGSESHIKALSKLKDIIGAYKGLTIDSISEFDKKNNEINMTISLGFAKLELYYNLEHKILKLYSNRNENPSEELNDFIKKIEVIFKS